MTKKIMTVIKIKQKHGLKTKPKANKKTAKTKSKHKLILLFCGFLVFYAANGVLFKMYL
jgi:hypothetical protein